MRLATHPLQPHPRARRAVVAIVLPTLAAAALVAGCGSSPQQADASSATAVGAADFKDTPVSAHPGAKPSVAPGTPPARASITPEQASGGIQGVTLLTGEPKSQVSGTARPAEAPLLVDALVGQINGKPVYASKFLAPLDGRLRAKVTELDNNRAWQREAGKIIYETLIDQIRDELFLAEARAKLSPEQRQGLLAFVDQLRRNFASQSLGSEELAEERAREQEGVSLDKKITDERDKALIRTLVSSEVNPRVNVSWKDIQRQYERDEKLYNPNPAANIRMIWVGERRAEAIKSVTDQLVAGTSFTTLAGSDLNEFSPAEGGLIERVFEPPFGSGRLWEDPTLNDNARKLTVGSTVGPFVYQGFQVWMHLDSISQKSGRSLEEAQIEIANKLRNQRFNDETNRLFNRILERGSRTNERDMTERLLLIASERYLLPQAAK
ncbi:MAG: hypothetical protein ACKVS8_08320 [Phycisphaerales bacterium]